MEHYLASLQSIDVAPWVLVVLTVTLGLQVASDPVLGRRDHRRLLATVAREGEGARLRLYRRWIAQSWAWAVLAVTLVAALPGVGPADLGLRLPELGPLLDRLGSTDLTAMLVTGMAAGAALGAVLALVLRAGTDAVPAASALAPMLPRTRRGRRAWAGLSVTAGITEEVVYRGLLVLTVALLLPGAHPAVVVAVGAVVFGVAHLYQGWRGVLTTAVVGAVLTALYLSTSSLLVPIVLHALMDLRALAVRPPSEARPGHEREAPPAHEGEAPAPAGEAPPEGEAPGHEGGASEGVTPPAHGTPPAEPTASEATREVSR